MQTSKSAGFLQPRRTSDGRRGRSRLILPRKVLVWNPAQWSRMQSYSRERRHHEAASDLRGL